MIRFYDVIKKKRDGMALSTAEIDFFVQGIVDHSIPDYQQSAFLMAIFFRGMDERETADLTMAMVRSGTQIELKMPKAVDKHSTGGVADTTTLVVAPIVAACGVPVAKMSGRGLGHTGGTVDKLESIPGFSTSLTMEQFRKQVAQIGLSIISATAEVVPADKVLYALRDVTATIDSIPLIASSIMSKKLAAGATHIVLDVKFGRGAFMAKYSDAERLARTMIGIGTRLGRPTVVLLTSMDAPLGSSIGNALEIKEALAILTGQGGSADLCHVSLALAREMILHYYPSMTVDEAWQAAKEALVSGRALAKWNEMVAAQGGDLKQGLPQAKFCENVRASRGGYIQSIDPLLLGSMSVEIGAGRSKKGDLIDYAAGFVIEARVGDYVEQGAPLLQVHSSSPVTAEFLARLAVAFTIVDQQPETSAWRIERIV
ncbi:MAG: thymidine phosphorylase [Firmicutes bacterium]|nr:thymidine phosphorylase [Dethiobacter sp.]MBS3889333.1 thymidine phosphorylase [Bacillota bacterium]